MKIYASNLSFHTSDAELNELFANYGEVTSAKVITDRETGRSRGFGFIEMKSDADANQAIASLDQKEVEGRKMSVSIAKEKSNNGFSRNSDNRYNNNKW